MTEGWQPIETAPQTGDRFVAAARIFHRGTRGRTEGASCCEPCRLICYQPMRRQEAA